jgi:hypothetical protein
MEVGFDLLGPLGREVSRVPPRKGDGERVEDEDAERHAERVNACSSAAVASRESRSSPVGDNLSSCTPTVQPERYVGIEYAIAAVILVAVVRNDNDTGGHAVCDRKEYSNLGASKVPEAFGKPPNAYRESK